MRLERNARSAGSYRVWTLSRLKQPAHKATPTRAGHRCGHPQFVLLCNVLQHGPRGGGNVFQIRICAIDRIIAHLYGTDTDQSRHLPSLVSNKGPGQCPAFFLAEGIENALDQRNVGQLTQHWVGQ